MCLLNKCLFLVLFHVPNYFIRDNIGECWFEVTLINAGQKCYLFLLLQIMSKLKTKLSVGLY